MGTVDLNIKVPSWNAAYRIHNKMMYKTAEAKAFQDAIGYVYKGDHHKRDVEVFIEFHRAPLIDIDNGGSKLILDALEGIAYKNDRQVCSLTIDRYKCENGKDHVFISVNSIDKENV